MASNSKLLKMARARDDRDLVLRVAAGLTLHAQAVKGWDLPDDTRLFVDWIMANPMTPLPRALTFIVANPTVESRITMADGTISSEQVTDDDIMFIIAEAFDSIATAWRKYGAS